MNTLKNIIKLITDLKYTFYKDFIKKNYYKHFLYSILVVIPFILLLNYLGNSDILFQLFLGGAIAYMVNHVREVYMMDKYNAPFSQTDINFGIWGGIVGAGLIILIY